MALSPVTRTTLVGDVDNGEDVYVGAGLCGKKISYCLLSFAVNLKLLSKFITLKKKNVLYMTYKSPSSLLLHTI